MSGFITNLVTPLVGLGGQYLNNQRQGDILIANQQAQAQVAAAQARASESTNKLVMYGVFALVAILLITKKA